MSNYRQYTIKQGDNLQIIAQRVLGDASRGMEIALINNLNYPFISSEGLPNTKSVGDTLYIPVKVDDEEIVDDTPEVSIQVDSDLLLSNSDSLSFNWGGEFKVDVHGDLTTVSELKCLYQDIRHRLIVEQGTLLYHPEYGSRLASIIGSKKDSTWVQKSIIEVHRCISCDDRVESISDIQVSNVDTGVHIKCIVVTKQAQMLKFESDLPIQ